MFPKDSDLIKFANFVDGEWGAAQAGETLAVTNPATGEVLGEVPCGGAADAAQAVAAAARALPQWRGLLAKERAAVLMRWFALIQENAETLAQIMTAEQGKPLAEARGEVAYGASFLQWFAEEARRGGGEMIPPFKAGAQVRVTREAAGVAAMITPWNFPLAMITRKVGAAFAAGCTAVIKPANLTPLTALAAVELAHRAGVPKGVINILTGDSAAIGGAWCEAPDVRVLSFTGSTEVGVLLAAQCAPTVKKLALELGGNAPFIVFDDADMQLAVEQAILSKFRNAGQTCVCANRFYIHEAVHDDFVARIAERARAMKVGNGADDGVTIGPLINAAAVEKAQAHVGDAVAGGAKVVCGGAAAKMSGELAAGNFFQPTVLTGMKDSMLVSCEETFAPVAAVYSFADEAEVVARANATQHGLAAYFCSRDVGRVMRVSESLEAGIVGVNEGIISTEVAPFGGVKASGLGREGSHYGMDEYVEIKYTLIGYPQQ